MLETLVENLQVNELEAQKLLEEIRHRHTQPRENE